MLRLPVANKGSLSETASELLDDAGYAGRRDPRALNSIDADGTKSGFDIDLISAIRQISTVPVIAIGGVGALERFAPAIDAGADTVLAASVFHNGELIVGDVKRALAIHTTTIDGGMARVQAVGCLVAGSSLVSEFQELQNKAAAPQGAVAVANAMRRVQ